MRKLFRIVIFSLIVSGGTEAWSQSEADPPAWDQLFFFGNKVSWGKEKWKYSGELQIRLQENGQSLDNWYLEGVASYMPSKHWEVVPDFRFSIHPEQVEYRPGLGVLRKDLFLSKTDKGHQIVNQVKIQADFQPGNVNTGLRYILFYNYLASEKIILSGLGGIFYTWKDNFTGLEYIRAGGGAAYIFNMQHSLNLLYLVGVGNLGDSWNTQGNLVLQLVINVNKDYKYVPAKYLNL